MDVIEIGRIDAGRIARPMFQNAVEEARKYRRIRSVREHAIETAQAAARIIRAATPHTASFTLKSITRDAIRNTPCKI